MIRAACVAGTAVCSWVIGACALQPLPISEETPPSPRIAIDGVIEEWPPNVHAVMDQGYLHLRFSPPGIPRTLQSSTVTTTILLDTDVDAETGRRERGLGAELAIELSPDDPGNGVAVTRYDADGTGERIGHAAIDFHFAPTHSAASYEARIALDTGKDGAGIIHACRGVVTVDDDQAWSQPFEVIPRWWREGTIAPSGNPAPPSMIFGLPRSDERALRILSWNVLRGKPADEPEAFARVILNADPDVVLVQEWDGADGKELARWFNQHVGGSRTWTATARPSAGVGVVTWHQIVSEQDDPFPVEGEWPARCHAALVRTPVGDILSASMHLKCCGSAGSSEDQRRVREVEAIRDGLPGLFAGAEPATVIVGGDINLVGSRKPLDVLAESLDVDGTSLAIADASVKGDHGAHYTWTHDRSSFSPGRLDWVLVGDANAKIADAFVLDMSRVVDARRIAHALQPGDTSHSDHLPVVVDVVVEED